VALDRGRASLKANPTAASSPCRSHPTLYVTCLDLGSYGAVLTVGWDRTVQLTRQVAKDLKRDINASWIYPPLDATATILDHHPVALSTTERRADGDRPARASATAATTDGFSVTNTHCAGRAIAVPARDEPRPDHPRAVRWPPRRPPDSSLPW
jgi:hypothetical protein